MRQGVRTTLSIGKWGSATRLQGNLGAICYRQKGAKNPAILGKFSAAKTQQFSGLPSKPEVYSLTRLGAAADGPRTHAQANGVCWAPM